MCQSQLARFYFKKKECVLCGATNLCRSNFITKFNRMRDTDTFTDLEKLYSCSAKNKRSTALLQMSTISQIESTLMQMKIMK